MDLEHGLLSADRISCGSFSSRAVAEQEMALDPLQLLTSGVWELLQATPLTGLCLCFAQKLFTSPFFPLGRAGLKRAPLPRPWPPVGTLSLADILRSSSPTLFIGE